MSGKPYRTVHVDGQEWRYTLSRRGPGSVRIFNAEGKLLTEVDHHVLLGFPSAHTLFNARDDMRRGYVKRDDSHSITPAVVKAYVEQHLTRGSNANQ